MQWREEGAEEGMSSEKCDFAHPRPPETRRAQQTILPPERLFYFSRWRDACFFTAYADMSMPAPYAASDKRCRRAQR